MAEYNVHLIEPVQAGPILTLDQLEQEKWQKQAELLVLPIETQHAADQLAELIAAAEDTLADMETYLRSKHQQHWLDAHIQQES
jgi:hypothetical protein